MVGWTTLHQCCRLEYASCRRNDRFWPRLCEKPKTLDCDRISYSFKTALGAHIGKPNLLLTSNLRTSFLSGFDFLSFHTGWVHRCPGRVLRHFRSWRKPTPHSRRVRWSTDRPCLGD